MTDSAHSTATPTDRYTLEAAIEAAIAALDAMDGDPDLEDGADAEDDPAEDGVADLDALDDPDRLIGDRLGLYFDGSGIAIARDLIHGRAGGSS